MRIYMFLGVLFVSPFISAAVLDVFTPQNCGNGYLYPCLTEEIQQERFWSAFGAILVLIFLVAILLRGLKKHHKQICKDISNIVATSVILGIFSSICYILAAPVINVGRDCSAEGQFFKISCSLVWVQLPDSWYASATVGVLCALLSYVYLNSHFTKK